MSEDTNQTDADTQTGTHTHTHTRIPFNLFSDPGLSFNVTFPLLRATDQGAIHLISFWF